MGQKVRVVDKRVEKYFKGSGIKGIIADVLRVLVAIIIAFSIFPGQKISGKLVCIFVIILLIGLTVYDLLIGKVTDAEIDALVGEKLKGFQQRALDRLGLEADEANATAPLMYIAYVFDDLDATPTGLFGRIFGKGEWVPIRKGKDDVWRSNRCQATAFYFSEDELYCYRYRFSIGEFKERETTDVVFYKDIEDVKVMISSKEQHYRDHFRLKKERIDANSFSVISGGVALECYVKNMGFAKKSIYGMRNLIKAKKKESI